MKVQNFNNSFSSPSFKSVGFCKPNNNEVRETLSDFHKEVNRMNRSNELSDIFQKMEKLFPGIDVELGINFTHDKKYVIVVRNRSVSGCVEIKLKDTVEAMKVLERISNLNTAESKSLYGYVAREYNKKFLGLA